MAKDSIKIMGDAIYFGSTPAARITTPAGTARAEFLEALERGEGISCGVAKRIMEVAKLKAQANAITLAELHEILENIQE